MKKKIIIKRWILQGVKKSQKWKWFFFMKGVGKFSAHFHFVVASQIENPKANRKVRVPVRVYQQFQIRLVIKVISVCNHVSYEY